MAYEDSKADDKIEVRDEEESSRKKMTAQKVLTMFADAYRATAEFRDNVVDAFRCLSGDSWPDAVKEAMRRAGAEGAMISINKMLMPLMFITGVYRQTREEPKLIAFEGGDVRSTELMNALVHWQEAQYDADQMDAHVFQDKAGIGLGWWKYSIDYTDPQDIEGRIVCKHRHPLAIFPDPNWLDSGWGEARYVIDARWYTPAEAAENWPEYADEFKRYSNEWLRAGSYGHAGALASPEQMGDSLATERLFFDPITKRVRVAECWYKVTKKVTVAYDQETEQVSADEELVKRLKTFDKVVPGRFVFIPRTVNIVKVANVFNDCLLDDEVSPHDPEGFPIFPSLGTYFWKHPFGLADMMKDLQREINKRRSKLIELTGRMPLSGFLVKNSETQSKLDIKEYGNGNGVQIGYDVEPPVPIKPPELPMSVLALEDKASAEIKDVPNVHNELLGQATQKTISGKAIEARQRGGLVSHEYLFDSFRKERELRVKYLIGLIKQYVSPTKALRILGSIAVREPEGNVAMMMNSMAGGLAGSQSAPGMAPGSPPGGLPLPSPGMTQGPGVPLMEPQLAGSLVPPGVEPAPPVPGMAPPGAMMPGLAGSLAAPPIDPMAQGMMDIEEMLSSAYDAEYDVVIAARPAEPSLAMESFETLADLKEKGAEIPPKVLWSAAKKAGVISEDDMAAILEFIQQQQMAMQQGPPPGTPPPAPAPVPLPGGGGEVAA